MAVRERENNSTIKLQKEYKERVFEDLDFPIQAHILFLSNLYKGKRIKNGIVETMVSVVGEERGSLIGEYADWWNRLKGEDREMLKERAISVIIMNGAKIIVSSFENENEQEKKEMFRLLDKGLKQKGVEVKNLLTYLGVHDYDQNSSKKEENK